MKIHFGAVLVCVAYAATPALATDLTESIADTLDDVDEQFDDIGFGGLVLRPTFSQSVIWTDNVYLNDKGERPVTLTSFVSASGREIKDKQTLRRIQKNDPNFRDLESQGRVHDWISRTELGGTLVKQINPDYTKLLRASEINVLSASIRHHEYLDENDLDSTDYSFGADWFGFLSDLFSFEQGNRFWVRAGGDFERLEEPLDTDITELQQVGIDQVDFRSFERTEWEIRGDAGYVYNRFDVSVGAMRKSRRLADRELRKGEYDRNNFHMEAGYEVPQLQQKRVFMRVDWDEFKAGDRALDALDGDRTQALNDGDRLRLLAGVEGAFISEKLVGRVGAGYEAWDPDFDSGDSGDRSSYNAMVATLQLAYRPWEERKTQFQLSYDRTAEASALSNYNDVHRGTITATHPIADGWTGDASLGFTRTAASEGPRSKLYDLGLGVSYQWFKQVSVSLRYSYRYSDSSNEIFISSSFSQAGRQYTYDSESNGDFYSNTLELALDVEF